MKCNYTRQKPKETGYYCNYVHIATNYWLSKFGFVLEIHVSQRSDLKVK